MVPRIISRPLAGAILLDFLAPRLYSTQSLNISRIPKPRRSNPKLQRANIAEPSVRPIPDKRYNTSVPPSIHQAYQQRLESFRKAMESGSLSKVSQEFQSMKKQNLLVHIRMRECHALSSFLQSVILQIAGMKPSAKQVDHERVLAARQRILEDIRDMVVFLDSRTESEPLCTFLKTALQLGDADMVLKSWKQAIEAAHEGDVGRPDEASTEIWEVSDLPNTSIRPRFSPKLTDSHERRCIQVIAIAAHALRGDIGTIASQLQTTKIPLLSLPEAEALLSQLVPRHQIQPVLRFYETVETISRIFSPGSSGLKDLFRDRNTSEAWKCYSLLMEGCQGDRPWCTPSISQDGTEGPARTTSTATLPPPTDLMHIDSSTWSVFLSGFVDCQKMDLATQVWNDMQNLGVTPSKYQWNIMLNGHGQRGDIDQMTELWEEIGKRGIERDAHAYTTLMSAFFEASLAARGMGVFDTLKQEFGGKTADGAASTAGLPVIACNAAIHGLLINNLPDIASKLLFDMHQDGPQPDSASYNTFLRYHSRRNDEVQLLETVRAMERCKIPYDVFTYTTLLDFIHTRNPKWEAAVGELFKAMSEMGVKPNEATFTAVIDAIVRRGGEENMRMAMELLDPLEERQLVNEVTYTSILAGVKRDRTIPRDIAKSFTDNITLRMNAQGLEPNRITVDFLIDACLQRGDQAGLQEAMSYWRSIKRGHIPERTYLLLLPQLIRRREVGYIAEVLQRMKADGFEPRRALARMVTKTVRMAQLGQLGAEMEQMFQ